MFATTPFTRISGSMRIVGSHLPQQFGLDGTAPLEGIGEEKTLLPGKSVDRYATQRPAPNLARFSDNVSSPFTLTSSSTAIYCACLSETHFVRSPNVREFADVQQSAKLPWASNLGPFLSNRR